VAKEKEVLTPDDPDEGNVEIKQGVINVAKKTTRYLRIVGFRGVFKSVMFNDNGVSTTPVSEELRSEIRKQWPKAKIEDIDSPAANL
jgi:hypothetical protein